MVNVNTRELGSIGDDMDIPSVISQPVPANSTNTCSNNLPVEPSGVAAAKKLYEAERRAVYEKVPSAERKWGKRNVDEIEPALDDTINARTHIEISCSQAPAVLYFHQKMFDQ